MQLRLRELKPIQSCSLSKDWNPSLSFLSAPWFPESTLLLTPHRVTVLRTTVDIQSHWHLWKCGQCFKTFTQRILLQMHVCTQNPDR